MSGDVEGRLGSGDSDGTLHGRLGQDLIGGGNADLLYGDPGNDMFWAGLGRTTVDGGNHELDAGAKSEGFYFDDAGDVIWRDWGEGHDEAALAKGGLSGSAGADVILAGGGHGWILGDDRGLLVSNVGHQTLAFNSDRETAALACAWTMS